jgi:hypothetical protein
MDRACGGTAAADFASRLEGHPPANITSISDPITRKSSPGTTVILKSDLAVKVNRHKSQKILRGKLQVQVAQFVKGQGMSSVQVSKKNGPW